MNCIVIGGGKMGMSHLALISKYLGKNNTALCDNKIFTRLMFHLLGFKTFASLDHALSNLKKIDAILISTPTPSHITMIDWAFKHKIPFFVEKPLTLNAPLSYELVKKANLINIKAQVGFVMRYVASFDRLKQLVTEGILGKPLEYSASMAGNVITKPLPLDSWKSDYKKGGGCLNEYGPHIVDLCRYIFGPVSNISDASYKKIYSPHADDAISIRWTHQSNLMGNLNINWCDPSKRKSVIEFFVKFEYAEIRVDNSALEIFWHVDAPLPIESRNEIESINEPVCVDFYLRGEEFSLQLEDFISLLSNNEFHKTKAPRERIAATLKDGYEVDMLLVKIAEKAGLA